MSWAKTEKNKIVFFPFTLLLSFTFLLDLFLQDPDDESKLVPPFTEEDRRKRCPHQYYRETIRFERLVAHQNGLHRNRLHTLILTMGHLYGDGEEAFHPWFRQAWEGTNPALVIYGNGNNTLPCIHVRDVCQIAGHVIKEPQEEPLLLCVDEGRYTQEQIVTTISKTFGTGEVTHISQEQAFEVC